MLAAGALGSDNPVWGRTIRLILLSARPGVRLALLLAAVAARLGGGLVALVDELAHGFWPKQLWHVCQSERWTQNTEASQR